MSRILWCYLLLTSYAVAIAVPACAQESSARRAAAARVIAAARNEAHDLKRTLSVNMLSAEAGQHNQKVLQAALDAMRGGERVTLPAGLIAIAGEPKEIGGIKALLHTPQVMRGGIIEGQGESSITRTSDTAARGGSNNHAGSFTALVYVGPEPTEPTALLAMPSSRDMVVQNLSFHGRPFVRDPQPKNFTALAIVRGENGVGSGHHKLRQLTFDKWDVAIQFGVDIKDPNNDVCFIERPTFTSCRIATQLNSHMAMGHTLVYPVYESGVDIALQVNAGGSLAVWGGFIAAHLDTFLELHDCGSNNGRYEFHGLCHHGIDGTRHTKFVSMPSKKNNPATITFENLDVKPQVWGLGEGDSGRANENDTNANGDSESETSLPTIAGIQQSRGPQPPAPSPQSPTPSVMFDIRGPVELYLDKCYGLQRGTIRLRSSGKRGRFQPFLDVNRCVLRGGDPNGVADLISADSAGKYHWKGTANRRYHMHDNTPLKDEQNY